MKTPRTLRPTLLQRLRALGDEALHRLWHWSQRSTARAPVLVPVRVRDDRHLPHHPQRQRQRYRPYGD